MSRAGGRALAQWLASVRDLGFALLAGVPTEPGMVCRVVELFGYVPGRGEGATYTCLQAGQLPYDFNADGVPDTEAEVRAALADPRTIGALITSNVVMKVRM